MIEKGLRRPKHLGHVGVVGPLFVALTNSCEPSRSVRDQPWQRRMFGSGPLGLPQEFGLEGVTVKVVAPVLR
jgi:hypothetical protein